MGLGTFPTPTEIVTFSSSHGSEFTTEDLNLIDLVANQKVATTKVRHTEERAIEERPGSGQYHHLA
jgi:hypothetical protein